MTTPHCVYWTAACQQTNPAAASSSRKLLPHKTLLQVFELLGNEHPLVTVYRRKLFAALY